jgi:hypothetical protein
MKEFGAPRKLLGFGEGTGFAALDRLNVIGGMNAEEVFLGDGRRFFQSHKGEGTDLFGDELEFPNGHDVLPDGGFEAGMKEAFHGVEEVSTVLSTEHEEYTETKEKRQFYHRGAETQRKTKMFLVFKYKMHLNSVSLCLCS